MSAQLFDHGIDSLNCVLGGIVQVASVGLGHSPKAAALIVLACWPMYLVRAAPSRRSKRFTDALLLCTEHVGGVSYSVSRLVSLFKHLS